MKKVPVRQFQLHATQYLKELPIVLTQYGKVVADVMEHSESSVNTNKMHKLNVLTETVKKVSENVNTSNGVASYCQMPQTICHEEGRLYKITSYTEEGEQSKELLLCDKHLKIAQRQGMEVAII